MQWIWAENSCTYMFLPRVTMIIQFCRLVSTARAINLCMLLPTEKILTQPIACEGMRLMLTFFSCLNLIYGVFYLQNGIYILRYDYSNLSLNYSCTSILLIYAEQYYPFKAVQYYSFAIHTLYNITHFCTVQYAVQYYSIGVQIITLSRCRILRLGVYSSLLYVQYK